MKIALLTHRYPLPEKPKLKSDVDALHHIAKWWARDGHAVHVIVLYQHQNLHDGVPKPFFYTARLSDLERDGVHVHLVETRFIHALPRLSDAYFNILGKKAAGKIEKPFHREEKARERKTRQPGQAQEKRKKRRRRTYAGETRRR